MSEEAPVYQVNESDALLTTAREISRLGNRAIILDLRKSFLSCVDLLERAAGLSPTTAEIRAQWRLRQNGLSGNGNGAIGGR